MKKVKTTSQNVKQKVKKQRKKQIVNLSSDSEAEPENFHISSNEDEVDDFTDSQRTTVVGDFVLVKFTTKSSFMHYIGRIMKVNGDDYSINFLRRYDASSCSFIYLEKEDVATVSKNDVIKLPHSMISGGTERVALKMKFDCEISKYQNLY